MSWSDLASLGSFISGFAVLVSLIFLYFQLRQIGAQVKLSEKNQQAAIRHGRTNRAVELFLYRTDPSVADAVAKGMQGDEDVSETQFRQFASYCSAHLSHAEDSFYQHQEGLLNDEAYAYFVRGMTSMCRAPGFRVIAKRGVAERQFAAFLEKLISEASTSPLVDLFSVWKADVAAQKALVASAGARRKRSFLRKQGCCDALDQPLP